jgi:hypothetical protein
LEPRRSAFRAAFLNGTLPTTRFYGGAIENRFIALFKPPFKCSDDYRRVGWRLLRKTGGSIFPTDLRQCIETKTGECNMARFEILDASAAPLGEGAAAGDMLFELGMMYSVGRDVPVDLIAAHKWFNLAAVKGNGEAVRLRREVAYQMSEREIAAAQRAARDWLQSRRDVVVPAPAMAA